MGRTKLLTYLEQKEHSKKCIKWLEASNRFSYLLAVDKAYNIDVPVENDVKMEFD